MFRASVEQWRPLAEQFSGDAPPNFLLYWIDGESGGNRCNLTTSAGFPEVGLFQLDPGNAKLAGTDQDTLRAGCSGQTDTDGTDADRMTAMTTGVEYIKALKALARQRLRAVGADWSESDPGFWAFVRYHFSAGSGAAASALARATNNLGRAPTDWTELVANGSPSMHWADIATQSGTYAVGWSPSVFASTFGGGGLSRGEVVLISIVSIAAVFGALRFDRWLSSAKAV